MCSGVGRTNIPEIKKNGIRFVLRSVCTIFAYNNGDTTNGRRVETEGYKHQALYDIRILIHIDTTLEQYEETNGFFNVIVGSDAVGNSARSAGAANTIVFS